MFDRLTNPPAAACHVAGHRPIAGSLPVADLLRDSLAEALEVMAFVIAEPAAMPAEPAAGLLLTRVPIDGPRPMVLEFVCPPSLGAVLEANVGMDVPSDGTGAAALRELGNVACGLLIRRLREAAAAAAVGPDALIGLPVQEDVAAGGWAAVAEDPGAVVLDADGVRLAARVREAA
jgi:hypothetical protein